MNTWFERFAERERKAGRNKLIYDREGKDLYLERFYLVKRRYTLGLFNVCVHRFVRSDQASDGIHNHPWPWFTYLLKGDYYEVLPDTCCKMHINRYKRKQGSWRLRWPGTFHRIELIPHTVERNGVAVEDGEREVWTLFIMGPHWWKWGFYVEGKFYDNQEWLTRRGYNDRVQNTGSRC